MTKPLDLEPIKARLARFDGEDYPAGWKGEDIPALIAEVERLRAEKGEFRAMIQEASSLLDLRGENPALVEVAAGVLEL